MAYKDTLNQRLIVITYHLTTEQLFEARENRNWEYYDQLDEVQKLQHQLEEFSIYEDLLEGITDDDFYRILKEINNRRFD